jgi:hypothetical protein
MKGLRRHQMMRYGAIDENRRSTEKQLKPSHERPATARQRVTWLVLSLPWRCLSEETACKTNEVWFETSGWDQS